MACFQGSMLVGISRTSLFLVVVLGMLSCTPWFFGRYCGLGQVVGYVYLIPATMVACWQGILVVVSCVLRYQLVFSVSIVVRSWGSIQCVLDLSYHRSGLVNRLQSYLVGVLLGCVWCRVCLVMLLWYALWRLSRGLSVFGRDNWCLAVSQLGLGLFFGQ